MAGLTQQQWQWLASQPDDVKAYLRARAAAANQPNTTTTTTEIGPDTSTPKGGVGMTYDQVENIWITAGGNPQAAAMAAAVADASSGMNPQAEVKNPDGTTSRGLWQISSAQGALSTFDPTANARAAVQMSNNGTDWSQWCSTWSDNNCGLNDGKYLGEGSNALASLAGKLGLGSYNVAGSAPATGGGSASGTVANNTPAPTGGGNKTGLIAILGIIVLGVVIYAQRRARQQRPTAPPTVPVGP